MPNQKALFPETNDQTSPSEPEGFLYQEEIVSVEEEEELAAALGQLDLKPFEFHGHTGNRRVVSFGLKYDYSRRSVEKAADIPPYIHKMLGRVADFSRYPPDAFRQVGVNEYRSGAGIGWHEDKPEFGIIVGISLLAPAIMRFRQADGLGWKRISHTVKPRSIYLLSGEARIAWQHSIPPVAATRYSITFRTLSSVSRREKRK